MIGLIHVRGDGLRAAKQLMGFDNIYRPHFLDDTFGHSKFVVGHIHSLISIIHSSLIRFDVNRLGADHAAKYSLWKTKNVICMGRPGYTEIVRQGMKDDSVAMRQRGNTFLLSEHELKDVSSTGNILFHSLHDTQWSGWTNNGWSWICTEVRKILATPVDQWDELSTRGLLHHYTVEYLKAFFNTLYGKDKR
jgi:hypothetical protein